MTEPGLATHIGIALLAGCVVTACGGAPAEVDQGGTGEARAAAGPADELTVSAGADPGWTIEALGSPSGDSAASPEMTVEGDRAIVSWLDTSGSTVALEFAERRDDGWSEARTVVSGDDLVVNEADVPSVRALADGTLVAHWLEADGSDPEAYKLPLSWSHDDGQTWSAPITPHHDGRQVQHGFASLFQAPDAGLGLVWLDGRETGGQLDGSMTLRAAVYDTAGQQLSETLIDERVCDCCSLSTARTSEGIVAVYRDRSDEEIRDTSIARFAGGAWSEPVNVHQDGWQIEGCPVNGPAVSARGQDVVVAWFTAAGDVGRAYVAFSADGGRTFGPAIRVDDEESLGEVDVELLPDGSAAVTWVEFGQNAESRLRRIEPNGARSPAMTVADLSKSWAPTLGQVDGDLLLAWRARSTNGASRIQTARVSLD